MPFLFRALVVLAFVLCAAAPSFAVAPVEPWPHGASDLKPDPDVVFGTLPNGMRYAIKHNGTPKGAVSFRFRIDAGSLMERDNEQGIAHMLEHMAFRGSAHVADGDTVRILQSLGLTFGADTNAFTAATQTVYSFDVPKDDAKSVDTALMLLREIAGELNISQAALDTERNVVLAEAHLRDGPMAHLSKSNLGYLYGDRAASALTPIGLETIIAHATPQLIRDFYEAWYRPERATLLVVGDVDPKALEAKIRASFGDWQAKAPARPVPVYPLPAGPRPPVKLFSEPGTQSYILFNWLSPYDATADSKARETRDLLRLIALGVLNQRFANQARGATPPFISAGANHDHADDIADFTQIAVNYRQGQGDDGLKAVEWTWREAVAHGLRQDEVDQVIAQYRTFFQGNRDAADTSPSPQVVNQLLRTVDERDVYTSAQSDLALYEEIVKGLTADRVSAALKEMFGGTGPLVFVSSATPLPGGETAVMKALADADNAPMAAAVAAAAAPVWPYTQFGVPGKVVDRRTVDDLGVTFVRFANGVTLTVKPTKLRAGQVLVDVRIGSGRAGLPKDRIMPTWAVGGAVTQGGLGRYSIDDLQRRMADKLWGAHLGIGDDEFALSGATRPADLDAELQVLAAYVTDPVFKPEAFDQVRNATAGAYAQTETAPFSILVRQSSGLLHSGDARWRYPTLEEIRAATVDQMKAIVAPALAGGPIDIVVVGDVSVDQAVQSVSATFGALPKRPERRKIDTDEHFPEPPREQPVVLTHRGPATQAAAAIAWPTQGFMKDMKAQRTLRVLSEIFEQRLIDTLRTREGITYTPAAATNSSLLSDYGYIFAAAQVPPDKIANFYAAIASVEGDLKTNTVGGAELERARGPRVQDIQRQQQTNEYWLALLTGAAQDDRLLDVIRSTIPDLEGVTAEDVKAAASRWLRDDKAYRLVVVPFGTAPPRIQS